MSKSWKHLSHDLILTHACRFSSLHSVSVASRRVFDEGQAKRTATILIPSKFRCVISAIVQIIMVVENTNSGLCIVGGVELDDTSTAGATIQFILYLGALDFSDSSEELNKILVTSRPRQLESSAACITHQTVLPTYIAHENDFASLTT